MRTLYGRPFAPITTWGAADTALSVCPDYEQHRAQYFPRGKSRFRRAALPGQKLLCYAHVHRLSGWVLLTSELLKGAQTTMDSALKAYPSGWYLAGDGEVFVRFPESIDYGVDLATSAA